MSSVVTSFLCQHIFAHADYKQPGNLPPPPPPPHPDPVFSESMVSDAGLQLSIEQGSVVGLQIGVDDRGVMSHPAPVRPAVAALHFIQASDLLEAQNILEALLEVVRQEGVQDGVSAAVGVAQHNHEVEGALHGRGRVDGPGDGGDVEDVEGEPAEDEHRHHDGDHPCHLALGALALGGAYAYA